MARFSKGDRVHVFSRNLRRDPIYDGLAEIVKPTGIDCQYFVRFVNDPTKFLYARFCYLGENDELSPKLAALVMADPSATTDCIT
jgi:hypothetical protein